MEIDKINLTQKSKDNLCKLATYLQSLPKDYSHFGMSRWLDEQFQTDDELKSYLAGQEQYCGTVACAAGHGPAAGIPFKSPVSCSLKWVGYVQDNFTECDAPVYEPIRSSLETFLFGGSWTDTDDHHYGAAARIRFVLNEGGPPSDYSFFDAEIYKKYRVDEQVPKPTFLQKLTGKVPKPVKKELADVS